MPNPWTAIGIPYTRKEVNGRLLDTLAKEETIITTVAGKGIGPKFIEKG